MLYRTLALPFMLPFAAMVAGLGIGIGQTPGADDVSFLASSRTSALRSSPGRLASQAAGASKPAFTVAMRFAKFMRTHGHTYRGAEYERRMALFERRVAMVERHNSERGERGHTWRAAVNKLADRTEEELMQLRGYRPTSRRGRHAASKAPMELVGTGDREANLSALPLEFNWRNALRATSEVLDQRSCGSCWAFASSATMRAHAELFQQDISLSIQQIVSCTPNPHECGGRGGCTGATAELAMDYVARAGVVGEEDYPYTATESKCPENMKLPEPMDLGIIEGPAVHLLSVRNGGGASFGMTGFRKLPENRLAPLYLALWSEGPVSISLSAGDGWNMYGGGIYNSCPKDTVIDHAVMLVGWGEDQTGGGNYWMIQNSWGPGWGEDGYIRVKRRSHQEEQDYCGLDHHPEIGSGCRGGPKSVSVCGTCGILYDAVVPIFTLNSSGYWARHGPRNLSGVFPPPRSP